jgi:hypothetical protein
MAARLEAWMNAVSAAVVSGDGFWQNLAAAAPGPGSEVASEAGQSMLLIAGQYAAVVLAAGLAGVGFYAQFEHRKQSATGLALQALWWGVLDKLGVPGAFPYRADKLTAARLDRCLREGGTLVDPATK